MTAVPNTRIKPSPKQLIVKIKCQPKNIIDGGPTVNRRLVRVAKPYIAAAIPFKRIVPAIAKICKAASETGIDNTVCTTARNGVINGNLYIIFSTVMGRKARDKIAVKI